MDKQLSYIFVNENLSSLTVLGQDTKSALDKHASPRRQGMVRFFHLVLSLFEPPSLIRVLKLLVYEYEVFGNKNSKIVHCEQ